MTFPIHYHLPTHITPGGDDNIDMPDETRAVNADDVDAADIGARDDDLKFLQQLADIVKLGRSTTSNVVLPSLVKIENIIFSTRRTLFTMPRQIRT